MLNPMEVVMIQQMAEQGRKFAQIARQVGVDRKTVRRALAGKPAAKQPRPVKASVLEPFKDSLRTRLQQADVTAQHHAESPIAEAAPLRRFLSQGLAPQFIVGWLRLVVGAAATQLHQPARPLTADRVLLTDGGHGFTLGGGRQYFPEATALRIWMSSA